MNLDDAQRKKVATWIDEGLKLSDIQKRINSELGLTLTYMEVRLLVDDLKLVPKDPIPPPEPPAPEPPATPTGPSSSAKPSATTGGEAASLKSPMEPKGGGLLGGRVTVGVDTVARPGAMVSGNVTFSDGQKATWYLDQFGRLGVSAEKQGYKPLPADLESFQTELEKELAKLGY
jgi:hypothetical protein